MQILQSELANNYQSHKMNLGSPLHKIALPMGERLWEFIVYFCLNLPLRFIFPFEMIWSRLINQSFSQFFAWTLLTSHRKTNMKSSTLLGHLMASISIISSSHGSVINCGWQSSSLECNEGEGECCNIYGECGTGTNCEYVYLHLATLCILF